MTLFPFTKRNYLKLDIEHAFEHWLSSTYNTDQLTVRIYVLGESNDASLVIGNDIKVIPAGLAKRLIELYNGDYEASVSFEDAILYLVDLYRLKGSVSLMLGKRL